MWLYYKQVVGFQEADKIFSFAETPVHKHQFMKIFFKDTGVLSDSDRNEM